MSSLAVQPILALLADTPGGNPTQFMIQKALAYHDLDDWRYLTFEVHPESLGDAVRGMRAMGFRGGHCGPVHKEAVVSLLDRTSETAAAVGAVNVIFREEEELLGDNLEGQGLLAALRETTDTADKRVVLLGAGRAARAAALELAAAGVAEITVVNRTEAHAQELVDLLTEKPSVAATTAPWGDSIALPEGTDVLINATSIGWEDPDARLPVAMDSLQEQTIVADMTTDPPRTWLLREAEQRGCTTLDGLTMYVEQVALALQRWTAVDPDRDVMREAIEEFLEL